MSIFKIGDYVRVETQAFVDDKINPNNHIGTIVRIDEGESYPYVVMLPDCPSTDKAMSDFPADSWLFEESELIRVEG